MIVMIVMIVMIMKYHDDCDDHDDDDAKPQWLHLSFQMSPQSECFRGCIVRLVAFIETFHHLSAVEKSHHAKSQ